MVVRKEAVEQAMRVTAFRADLLPESKGLGCQTLMLLQGSRRAAISVVRRGRATRRRQSGMWKTSRPRPC